MSGGALACARAERVRVLAEDPGFLREVGGARRDRAERLSVARVRRSEPGPLDVRRLATSECALLVLDGLLVRRVHVDGRAGGELLTAGDVLRPWGACDSVVTSRVSWAVLRPLRIAVLDARWMRRMAPFPEVATELSERLLQRARRLLRLAAIMQQRRLEDRLCLTFTELADRFGYVHPDGIHVDVPLTHELLAEVVCARRPSVSTACGRLARAGGLIRAGTSPALPGDRSWRLPQPEIAGGA